MDDERFALTGFDTLAVRAGNYRSEQGEHSEALFLTSSFVFASAAEAAARFGGTEKGNIYSRFTNPTVRGFEERLAALEGGERAVATSSGMAAILAMVLGLLKAGDHVLASQSLFGTTNVLLEKYAAKFGISTTFVPLTDVNAWAQAMTPATRLLFVETPSNPLGEIADIAALADIAHAQGALLAVDNCFCTPALQRPLALGADLVIHSATKYLDGQGRCLGGAVVGPTDLLEEIYGVVRTCGPSMSPFNAWVFLKGLETLRLRMEAHSRSALQLAQWLSQQPAIAKVHYCGLPTHPQYDLVQRQQRGFGGVLSLELAGGREAAWAFIDATEVMSITANLGDCKTTITHPASTTHGRLSPEAKAAAGISEGLIRIAVGLEDIDDLIADCQRGLAAL
ncbi:MAG: O-succinylhomoserine sulfhydrylase [Moraxellaceae bacterium]|nr:O-succinylhomoserine sulfhydrylase [Moraxellaceae bacterium]